MMETTDTKVDRFLSSALRLLDVEQLYKLVEVGVIDPLKTFMAVDGANVVNHPIYMRRSTPDGVTSPKTVASFVFQTSPEPSRSVFEKEMATATGQNIVREEEEKDKEADRPSSSADTIILPEEGEVEPSPPKTFLALIQMKNGSLSPEELCKKCNRRREKIKSLNLYVAEIPEAVMLERSRESQSFFDKGNPRSLESIPIGFKNNFYIQGMRTTCASRLLLDFKPSYSATLVTRCIENGALLNGMHNMDEFAMGSARTIHISTSLRALIGNGTLYFYSCIIPRPLSPCIRSSGLTSCHGPSKNPWTLVVQPSHRAVEASSEKSTLMPPLCTESSDEDFYLPGGSSGASAAAVAAGACLAAFGSDTGGSVRLPAAFCGIVGLKPTYGLLSRYGLIPLMESTDCPGILTKTVEDCAIVLNSVLGYDSNDPSASRTNPSHCELDQDIMVSDIHIGIPKEYNRNYTSEEITALWQDVADMFAKAGAKVSQVSLPNTHLTYECYDFLCGCEIATTFSRYFGKEFGGSKRMEQSTVETFTDTDYKNFNEEVRKRLRSGINYLRGSDYEKRFTKAQKDREEITKDFKRVFESGVDLLLTPMSSTEAPLKSWFMSAENHEKPSAMFTFAPPANLAGGPAITLPVKLSQRGLPLNLQLIGRPFEEAKLLSVAYWLEQSAKCPRLSLDYLDEEKD